MHGRPAQFIAQRSRVDRVSQVVARTVGHSVDVVGVAVHQRQDRAQNRSVVTFAVGPDQIGPAHDSVFQDPPHRAVVVIDVDPIPHIGPGSVELGPPAGQHVGDLTGDEFLDVLERPVVIGAIGDRGPDAIGPHPRPNKEIRGGLAGRVRTRRVVGRGGGEPDLLTEWKVAVDLVGGDVV